MLPQALEIADLEPGAFRCGECRRDRDHAAVREHVPVDERVSRSALCSKSMRRAMPWLTKTPPGRRSACARAKNSGSRCSGDLLEHADGNDLVVRLRLVEQSIVDDVDPAAVGQARGGDPFPRELGLAFADGDPDSLDAEALRRVRDQPAEAAADVEQTLAGPEPELAAEDVELPLLGGVEVSCPATRSRRTSRPFSSPGTARRTRSSGRSGS